jgi:hypothetical protein
VRGPPDAAPSRAAFAALFDDGSLLGGIAIADAVARRRAAGSGVHAWKLGLLVCPAGRLPDLVSALDAEEGEPPLRVCVTTTGVAELAAAAWEWRPTAIVESVVVPAPVSDLGRAVTALPEDVLLRVAIDPEDAREAAAELDRIAAARDRLGRALGVLVRVGRRTGAYPVAIVLDACRRHALPVRWLDSARRLEPGSLVTAAGFAVDRRASVAALERVLDDGAAVGFGEHTLVWSGVVLGLPAIRAARALLVQGIGSPWPERAAATAPGGE